MHNSKQAVPDKALSMLPSQALLPLHLLTQTILV